MYLSVWQDFIWVIVIEIIDIISMVIVKGKLKSSVNPYYSGKQINEIKSDKSVCISDSFAVLTPSKYNVINNIERNVPRATRPSEIDDNINRNI